MFNIYGYLILLILYNLNIKYLVYSLEHSEKSILYQIIRNSLKSKKIIQVLIKITFVPRPAGCVKSN